MKKLIKLLLGLVAVVIVALLALPLWVGPVACLVANSVVPSKIKVPFNLGSFALNPYSGRLGVGDLSVGNPDGYKPAEAVKLGEFSVDVDMGSVLSDVIVVEEILVKDVFVSYVSKDGRSNFTVISENAAGEKAEAQPADGGSAEKEVTVPSAEKKTVAKDVAKEDAKKETKKDEKKSGKKFIFGRIRIEGVKVQVGFLPVPLPPITLVDIGRSSGGVSWDEAWDDIEAQLTKAVKAVGVDFEKLGALTGTAKEAVGDAAAKARGAVGDAAGKTKDAVNGAASKAKDAASGAASKAVDGANKALDKASGAIKGLFDR